MSDASRKVESIQRSLRNLQSSRSDKLSIFGSWVPELMRKVKQAERRFHRVPVGPIGRVGWNIFLNVLFKVSQSESLIYMR